MLRLGLAAYINDLKSQKEVAQKEAAEVQSKFNRLEKTLKSDTSQEVGRLKSEYETKLADELEKTRLEGISNNFISSFSSFASSFLK